MTSDKLHILICDTAQRTQWHTITFDTCRIRRLPCFDDQFADVFEAHRQRRRQTRLYGNGYGVEISKSESGVGHAPLHDVVDVKAMEVTCNRRNYTSGPAIQYEGSKEKDVLMGCVKVDVSRGMCQGECVKGDVSRWMCQGGCVKENMSRWMYQEECVKVEGIMRDMSRWMFQVGYVRGYVHEMYLGTLRRKHFYID